MCRVLAYLGDPAQLDAVRALQHGERPLARMSVSAGA
jgi:hypothetical protein